MKRTVMILSSLSALALLLGQCKDVYVSPYISPASGYLVVEGYISGSGPTSFTLSRTVPLSGNNVIPKESGAKVQVEGNDNSIYSLAEQGAGVYTVNIPSLMTTVNYRLRVTTGNGEIYLSDYAPYKITPAVDSISWKKFPDQVTIYANTHDPANTTRYYQWNYDETWEYDAGESSSYEYHPETTPTTVLPRPDSDQIFRCWRSSPSTTILVSSTTRLTRDVVYEQPIIHIPDASEQISVLYSVLVRQYALTEEGYNYLTLMQKNTESLGSIFDAQPSILKGNIHCLSDVSRPVLGFISAGTVTQQRIFISRSQVYPWNFFTICSEPDTVVKNSDAAFKAFYGEMGYVPIAQHQSPISGLLDGYVSNTTWCADCRTHGGTTAKPSFWPF